MRSCRGVEYNTLNVVCPAMRDKYHTLSETCENNQYFLDSLGINLVTVNHLYTPFLTFLRDLQTGQFEGKMNNKIVTSGHVLIEIVQK